MKSVNFLLLLVSAAAHEAAVSLISSKHWKTTPSLAFSVHSQGVRKCLLRKPRCPLFSRLQLSAEGEPGGEPHEASLEEGTSNEGLLEHFRVVLVNPQEAENIGSVARSCGSFECPSLWLVSDVAVRQKLEMDERHRENSLRKGEPLKPYLQSPADVGGGKNVKFDVRQFRLAKKLATPTHSKILYQSRVVSDLNEALKDCTSSVAFTRRLSTTDTGRRHASVKLQDVHRLASAQDTIPQRDGVEKVPSDPLKERFQRVALVFGNEASGLTARETEMCDHVCLIPSSKSLNLSVAAGIALARVYEEICLEKGVKPMGRRYS
uniref:tRNA/rRNA methyltransferase SpoU type domain-containing protein n=1 Tax=Chromera velia CCMP2878 TaxID=1169474 RepID=A0A0G4G9F8_9ALVE|eukprot:Cvel_20875.t1-p1 / transcript=Cvel_20875.t1 / gene=Cvel_20875 / organism=Chromera_velia_CCMP2878 / gene_product=hypothetical protein / transcript_product=hypothetical protein / location=Cvel_scaffold1913:25353-26312(+) / protein_length=320 / sequence_SO=supercontig / SO=protein_coding / is_pseudo=false